jgi:glyceraldehyde-3-phosphate dehydrogenase/erythrose-4-phosphate dehydrogenase
MTVRVGINGFGQIGRQSLRALNISNASCTTNCLVPAVRSFMSSSRSSGA